MMLKRNMPEQDHLFGIQRILAAAKVIANLVGDRRYGICFDAELMKFCTVGEVLERKIEDQSEVVKSCQSQSL